MDNNDINEQARRKRINLYKKIIIFTLIALILLPTILCIVLFIRIGFLNKELDELKDLMTEKKQQVAVLEDNNEDSEPDYYLTNTNKPSNTDKNTEQTESSDREADTEPVTEEVTPEAPTEEVTNETDRAVVEAVEYSPEVQQALADGRKVVYLTFDDGPWEKTDELLDILAQYNVKVTFFVNAHTEFEEEYRRIIDEGHTIGMHTYSHEYDIVYADLESFRSEVDRLSEYLLEVTGQKPFLFRFPGGSSTSMSDSIRTYIEYLNEKNLIYYDWNVASGDAVIDALTSEQIYNNVISGIEKKDVSVVLMHDTYGKETTIQAIPLIIEKLQAMDALILPITEETVPVHHNIK